MTTVSKTTSRFSRHMLALMLVGIILAIMGGVLSASYVWALMVAGGGLLLAGFGLVHAFPESRSAYVIGFGMIVIGVGLLLVGDYRMS